ncbi:hypothetical protein MSAN_01289400 [Mycena sanguinolenta]|uniref:Ser-Thr-rich glycosyl-phosphatidyl-inositol-anchored membrane family-domain-containing protein n=1 Tax=Mycena sanguinolenta TaxID=230812 RepID=A0A8H6YJ05_9AGAR|nr:hypothetical protein MSAN_01289400 [Mycena sanguinolenta]
MFRIILRLVLAAFVSSVSAYFVATAPQLNDQWANGQTRLVAWTKGVNDGVTSFDIEMSRLSADGLTLVAKNVPSLSSSQKSINILLQDVPPGDDYYLLFINSTCGVLYATSPPFAVLPAGASSTNGSTATNPKASTVTVSGAPNPTQTFAMEFAPVTSGALRQRWDVVAALGCILAWTLLW